MYRLQARLGPMKTKNRQTLFSPVLQFILLNHSPNNNSLNVFDKTIPPHSTLANEGELLI